jgi:hypothetical protein
MVIFLAATKDPLVWDQIKVSQKHGNVIMLSDEVSTSKGREKCFYFPRKGSANTGNLCEIFLAGTKNRF